MLHLLSRMLPSTGGLQQLGSLTRAPFKAAPGVLPLPLLPFFEAYFVETVCIIHSEKCYVPLLLPHQASPAGSTPHQQQQQEPPQAQATQCPSAEESTTAACMCWTPACAQCQLESQGSCSLVGSACLAVTSTALSSTRLRLCLTPSTQ
jgi:hypothetical protein